LGRWWWRFELKSEFWKTKMFTKNIHKNIHKNVHKKSGIKMRRKFFSKTAGQELRIATVIQCNKVCCGFKS